MKFRSFVALEIPPQIQTAIARKISPLVQHYPKPLIRWVEPNNYHLTLQFLADRTTEELDYLAESFHEKVSKIHQFVIRFLKLGTYPNFKKPKVIWVGIDVPPELSQMYRKIETICSSNYFPINSRDFSPHLTLGRIRDTKPLPDHMKFENELSSISFDSIEPVDISEVKIFKSDLRPSGPLYTVVHRIPLGIG